MGENKQKINTLILKTIGIHDHRDEVINSFAEEENLIKSLGGEVIFKTVQHRHQPDPNTYIGRGKIEEIKKIIKKKSIHLVLLNDLVNPGQIFRLEKELWPINPRIKIWDRYDLILNVFEKRAFSTEAKLQIELARLKHLGPRIYGFGGKILSRLGGGIGTRGLGEKHLEIMKRYIKKRINLIEKKINKIINQKKEKIINRKENGFKTIALVGYTNAGKTTLFNELTGKNKKVDNQAFTTLDSYVGKINLEDNSNLILADTIGFIKNLPPALIDSFKSTLMESLNAQLIFHVIDIADQEMDEKIKVVNGILTELNIPPEKIIYIFNKIDLIDSSSRFNWHQKQTLKPAFFLSLKTKQGLESLNKFLCHISK